MPKAMSTGGSDSIRIAAMAWPSKHLRAAHLRRSSRCISLSARVLQLVRNDLMGQFELFERRGIHRETVVKPLADLY